MEATDVCLFCNSNNLRPSWVRPTIYNEKLFKYKRCANCSLIQLSPLPNSMDMEKMYPSSYQGGVERIITDSKMPGLRFSYHYQFHLIEKFAAKNSQILDYGCGNGNFVLNALNKGYVCEGSEFGSDHVLLLNDQIQNSHFYTVDDFINNSFKKYDVIRLSNVLEHLTIPKEILNLLIQRLNPNGLLLIEGPIELNFSFAFMCRKIHVLFKNIFYVKKTEDHSVTHIFLSNRKNQHVLFKNMGLETLTFRIKENAWPYPETWSSCKSVSLKIKFILAQISILISNLFPMWGNTFIYVGKKK